MIYAPAANFGGAPSITFRRTEADRRPPRAVVTGRILGDPSPTRLEDAAAIRARIEHKGERMARVGTYHDARQQQSEANRKAILETISKYGAMTVTELMRHTGIHAGAVGQHITGLERAGTIRRTAMTVPKGQIVIVGLADPQNEENTDGQ